MKPIVNLYKLGRLPYVKASNVQQVLFDKLKHNVTSSGHGDLVLKIENCHSDRGTHQMAPVSIGTHQVAQDARNSLILVEHEPVYTIGIRSKQYNDNYVLRLKEKLDEHKLKADFIESNRGGLITFHGPGQLVAYPIIYLGDFNKTIRNRSVKAYVNLLEATVIDTLASVGVDGAHTVEGYPGVWLGDGERKIGFIGIACKRFVTMHGVSINCDCDLSWFDHIVSCGIEDKFITSVRRELLIKVQSLDQSHPKTNKKRRQASSTIVDNESFLVDASACSANKLLERVPETCIGGSKSTIESISRAFCQSFSRHFNCNLMDRQLDLKEFRPFIGGQIKSI